MGARRAAGRARRPMELDRSRTSGAEGGSGCLIRRCGAKRREAPGPAPLSRLRCQGARLSRQGDTRPWGLGGLPRSQTPRLASPRGAPQRGIRHPAPSPSSYRRRADRRGRVRAGSVFSAYDADRVVRATAARHHRRRLVVRSLEEPMVVRGRASGEPHLPTPSSSDTSSPSWCRRRADRRGRSRRSGLRHPRRGHGRPDRPPTRRGPRRARGPCCPGGGRRRPAPPSSR